MTDNIAVQITALDSKNLIELAQTLHKKTGLLIQQVRPSAPHIQGSISRASLPMLREQMEIATVKAEGEPVRRGRPKGAKDKKPRKGGTAGQPDVDPLQSEMFS